MKVKTSRSSNRISWQLLCLFASLAVKQNFQELNSCILFHATSNMQFCHYMHMDTRLLHKTCNNPKLLVRTNQFFLGTKIKQNKTQHWEEGNIPSGALWLECLPLWYTDTKGTNRLVQHKMCGSCASTVPVHQLNFPGPGGAAYKITALFPTVHPQPSVIALRYQLTSEDTALGQDWTNEDPLSAGKGIASECKPSSWPVVKLINIVHHTDFNHSPSDQRWPLVAYCCLSDWPLKGYQTLPRQGLRKSPAAR